MISDPSSTLRVELTVLGERVAVEAPSPQGPIRLDEVLPLMRAIDDRAIELAVRVREAAGERVSCCKGCSACCRAQPVPVTPAEAYALLRLVEGLAEPKQAEIRQRFADRAGKLRDAGLAEIYLNQTVNTMAEARQITERYFRLKLACPFLEDDTCGIYADRPFVCRQYLVTSPAELCKDPLHNPVRPIPVPIAAAGAALETATELTGTPQHTVPLVLALEFAQSHRQELERTYPARQLFERSLEAMANPAGE